MPRAAAKPHDNRRKRQNRRIGAFGEEAAEEYLRRQGYRILARNYSCRAGEIDIIAEHRGIIAFVEVKTRSPRAYLPPAEAVDAEKRARIQRAARFYLSSFRDPSPIRFDVVSIWLDAADAVAEIRLDADAFRS